MVGATVDDYCDECLGGSDSLEAELSFVSEKTHSCGGSQDRQLDDRTYEKSRGSSTIEGVAQDEFVINSEGTVASAIESQIPDQGGGGWKWTGT